MTEQTMADLAVSLLREVTEGHADPEDPTYFNDCDTVPCRWCENAAKVIKWMEAKNG